MNTNKLYIYIAAALVVLLYIFLRKKVLIRGRWITVVKTAILLTAAVIVGYRVFLHFTVLNLVILVMTLMVLGYILKNFSTQPDED